MGPSGFRIHRPTPGDVRDAILGAIRDLDHGYVPRFTSQNVVENDRHDGCVDCLRLHSVDRCVLLTAADGGKSLHQNYTELRTGRTKRCTGVAAGGFSAFRASTGRNPVNAIVRCRSKLCCHQP